ncbi:uncharacterized protein K489DRAFT_375284 [Dissoconium aciculare CBS 342.82]|uniref:Uncharacterized protein n=1 Tax=Dissoconium aciculare CBS 342.82 TaxID=1314786 RepID=A0A6J3MGX9_9PEZI|nr:uncharacterized protein K489DRAFT_375284 [Dissoconium aciculare CBS 342.82]KAF1827200.1 hypothetical protein K489DRAFT_375284 [Dissoconium aciculare CBS 342.82]
MSALRVARLRAVRPQLSPRYQALRRRESTNAKPPPEPTTVTVTTDAAADLPPSPPPAAGSTLPPPPPPPRPSFYRENRLLLFSGTLAVTLGFLGASFVLSNLNPPPFPEPGSHGDDVLMADLQARIDTDFKVSVMRGKCLGAARQLKGDEGPGWVEVLPAASPASSQEPPPPPPPPPGDRRDEAEKPYTLITTPPLLQNLQGAGRLGVERVFWHRSDRQLLAVVWFGGGLSGWPGVTHGGLLATALSEKLQLAARLSEQEDRAGGVGVPPQDPLVAGPARTHARIHAPPSPPTSSSATAPAPASAPDVAQLTLNYRRPTRANSFYVVRVTPADHASRSSGGSQREAYTATIEQMSGAVCVEATAVVASSSSPLTGGGGGREVGRKVSEKYSQFKQTMWPSRQEQTSSAQN